jgi:hypothetical protein
MRPANKAGRARTFFCLLGTFLFSVFSLFSCYAAIFWGWVTATPLEPAQVARAQYNTYTWFGLSVASGVAAFALAIWWMLARLGPRETRRPE